ncbi:MAG: hypothetical protein NTU81_03725 [Candidatus Nomurabacteria bacterium]|nr:hypothetical protein [Candidatus Nomurabacteria bacterium]
MRKYINKIKSKSEDTRKQILIGSLIVCMSFVGFIWINSFSSKFNDENSVKAKEDVKPFSLFSKTISDAYKNVTASVGNISSLGKQKEENIPEVKKGKQIDLIVVEPKTE